MQLKCPTIFAKITLLLILLSLAACAGVQKPLVGIVPGREVETLQSSIAITIKSGEHGSSGRGFLIFKYPDHFHLAVLSPFGPTVLDLYSDGEKLACLIPSRQTAYVGLIAELPEKGGFKTFGLLKWVVARTPPHDPSAGASELVTPTGERISYDKFGLVKRKVSPDGAEVDFAQYRNVSGIAFPDSMEIQDGNGASVRIVFDEPEINTPLDETVLTPRLEGLSVLPLSEFKGM